MLQHFRDLPHLRRRKHVFETGHAGQADSVFHLPVDFAGRIVRDHIFRQ
jgi:hypothetical protein